MSLYEAVLRPLLFRLEAEAAHYLTVRSVEALQAVPGVLAAVRAMSRAPRERIGFDWRGLRFPSPIGVAAGLDKNGRMVPFFAALGAGFVEVGTVTPRPQPGNPRPRVFRVPSDEAVINRLGFPSEGADRVAARLAAASRGDAVLGINVGMNATTPLEQAAEDYATCIERLYPVADYFVVNVSSPNTQGLTSLQSRPLLAALLRALGERIRELDARNSNGVARPRPLLVKISPDLADRELDDVAEVSLQQGVHGIVATNTSTDSMLRNAASAPLGGGLSGRPVFPKVLRAVSHLRRNVPDDFLILGVGGVFSIDDAWSLLRAGANAVQLYTGLVYRGPGLIPELNRALAERLGSESALRNSGA